MSTYIHISKTNEYGPCDRYLKANEYIYTLGANTYMGANTLGANTPYICT